MTAAVREAPHHRNLTCVKEYRCRRPECLARDRAYAQRRYRQKGYGTWQPLVDAAPARAHIDALRTLGHSIPDIQRAAHISPATIARILYNGVNKRAERIRPEVAERILAIPARPAPPKPTSIIDATGTRRRVQALIAMGWPATALSPLLGYHPRRIIDFAHAERVTASTARRIAAAYRKIHTWHPDDHGVPLTAQRVARGTAARNGWHGPLAWDDMDDPNCQPETAAPYKSADKYKRDPDRTREIEHLYLLGESPQQIAKQLGGNEKCINDQLTAILRAREARRLRARTRHTGDLETAA